MQQQRMHSLDGLRALSIALVILGHVFQGSLHAENKLTDLLANTGVRIFFVISGYLITTLLLREPTIDLRGFYVRRFWRIVPPLAALLAFAVLAVPGVTSHDLLRATTFTVNYDLANVSLSLRHLWSLSVEEQFYLLWPPFLVWATVRRGPKMAAIVVAVLPLIRLAEHHFGVRTAGISWEFHTVADAIAIGCLLAFNTKWANWRTAALCTVAFFACYRLHCSDTLGKTALNILIACGLQYCLTHRMAALNWRPIMHVGVLSYSLYLWQQLFIFTLNPLTAIALSFLCAETSYWLIEKPCIRLGRKLATRNKRDEALRKTEHAGSGVLMPLNPEMP